MFSKSCEYGLRAAIYIAEQSSLKKKVGLKEIASAIDSPEPFTGKILQILTKNNIASSLKGPHGGFFIEEVNLKKIKLSNIVSVLDGDTIYTGCALGLKQCDHNSPCPLHIKFIEIRESLKVMLEETTLYDILYSEDKKNTFWLKR
ncbi:Rrf2 family transcriptional regulator [Tenacibaculum dicentrarchi]|uniref:Transcriptional regulator, BadM/Rrf2 family n=1 Tax=Tenacibaculum dicentrarchi TaxID=669041 RepID=A0ABM9NZA2_9FLAO|nr:Rrf2 family transcriptional regulator [Tenacibaculum dicentrarchi]MCD8406451.1 Rrf2 family transcriptional regulator [Tenacibaculum dicentrarchi]MCD8415409.1 Rrf2 family transcriptional regulator [Tenacibaculum dicentrarchi]MCD8420489.1 Rrf2 family transcriptional regulator [Tenacibaculum dicentrarchi]MCD8423804.1 Rrf2 family transcriptional regulator [Tenacibaculum dicentrarchi]